MPDPFFVRRSLPKGRFRFGIGTGQDRLLDGSFQVQSPITTKPGVLFGLNQTEHDPWPVDILQVSESGLLFVLVPLAEPLHFAQDLARSVIRDSLANILQ